MYNRSTNNFFNHSFQTDNHTQIRQLFLLTGLSLIIAALTKRFGKPAMFMLLVFITAFATSGMAQA